MIGIGIIELLVLMISMLGPLIAGAYLIIRLNQRRREHPTTQ